MWIFTTTGYISAVENQEDKRTLILRARVKNDLVRFKTQYMNDLAGAQGAITFHRYNDYPYRLIVDKASFQVGLMNAVLDIDYKNFKSAVAKVQGHERSTIYSRIWAVLIKLEVNPRRIRDYFAQQELFSRQREGIRIEHGQVTGSRERGKEE